MDTHLNCINVDAIQMGTHNICLYKAVDKKCTGCNLKNTELLDCALIGVCAVIRSNTCTVCFFLWRYKKNIDFSIAKSALSGAIHDVIKPL